MINPACIHCLPNPTATLHHEDNMGNLYMTKKAQEGKGRMCGIVERYCENLTVQKKCPGIRSDLFELFDLLSIHPSVGIVGVQSCGQDFAAHYKKITIEKRYNTKMWLDCGGKIELWGWRRLKRENGLWVPRIVNITYNDLMV